jgi:hypothetical protein
LSGRGRRKNRRNLRRAPGAVIAGQKAPSAVFPPKVPAIDAAAPDCRGFDMI